jgi:hypothetical protein
MPQSELGSDLPQFQPQGFPYLPPSHVDDWVLEQSDLQCAQSADYVPSYASLSLSSTQAFPVDASSRWSSGIEGQMVSIIYFFDCMVYMLIIL